MLTWPQQRPCPHEAYILADGKPSVNKYINSISVVRSALKGEAGEGSVEGRGWGLKGSFNMVTFKPTWGREVSSPKQRKMADLDFLYVCLISQFVQFQSCKPCWWLNFYFLNIFECLTTVQMGPWDLIISKGGQFLGFLGPRDQAASRAQVSIQAHHCGLWF